MTSFGHTRIDVTPEMEQAERELDSRIDYALLDAHDARAALEEVERNEVDEPITDEEVERFRLYVTGHARTDAWQPVFDRIERGELTWREVVENYASGDLDRETAKALTSMQHVPAANAEQLAEIGITPAAPQAEVTEPQDEPEESAHEDVGSAGGRLFAEDDDW